MFLFVIHSRQRYFYIKKPSLSRGDAKATYTFGAKKQVVLCFIDQNQQCTVVVGNFEKSGPRIEQ